MQWMRGPLISVVFIKMYMMEATLSNFVPVSDARRLGASDLQVPRLSDSYCSLGKMRKTSHGKNKRKQKTTGLFIFLNLLTKVHFHKPTLKIN